MAGSALTKHGYIASYDANFNRPGSSNGIHTINSEVTAYRSVTGARWEYARMVQANRQQVAKIPKAEVHQLSPGGLGDRRSGLIVTEHLGKLGTITFGTVAFQRGRYWGAISILAAGHVSAQATRHYAHLIDLRVAAAGTACTNRA